MRDRTSKEKIDITTAVNRLISNEPQWNSFLLENILCNGRMDDNDILQLAEALKINKTITYVDITLPHRSCWILICTSSASMAFGKALKDHPALEFIKFDFRWYSDLNLLGDNIDEGFFEILTGKAPIIHLQILAGKINEHIINRLSESLSHRNTLKTFSLITDSPYSFVTNGMSRDRGDILSKATIEKFFTSLSTNCFLQELYLTDLKIGDHGLEYFATYLSNNLLLKSLVLERMNISVSNLKILVPYFKMLLNLSYLNLSDNVFGMEGICSVINILSSLHFLKKVTLLNNKLDKHASDFLVNRWRELQLRISELTVEAELSNASLHKLIDGNSWLKKLILKQDNIDNSTQSLLPLLSNKNRCHLEVFSSYYHGVNLEQHKTDSKIYEAMNDNFFIEIRPLHLHYNETYFNLRERNRKNIIMRYQQHCIEDIIEIANVYTSPFEDKSIDSRDFPEDIFLTIISMLYKSPFHLIDIEQCSLLILNNFVKRRSLISQNIYNPKKPEIEKWWKKRNPDKSGEIKNIFIKNHNSSLFFHRPAYEMQTEFLSHQIFSCSIM